MQKLTPPQIAAMLDRHVQTVYGWIHRKKKPLEAEKHGSSWIVLEKDLQAFLARNRKE